MKLGTTDIDLLSIPQQQYVEAIRELVDRHGHAHPTEIAGLLKVKKPSVTEAVSRLVDLGIAERGAEGVVLCKKGAKVAESLAERHEALRSFMQDVLGMDPGSADVAACRIEHSAAREFTDRLSCLRDFLQQPGNARLRKKWNEYLETVE